MRPSGTSGSSVCNAINWRNRSATGGLVIGDRSAWGRAMRPTRFAVRTRFAFAQLGLHRINGHTFNPAMKRVYEKCGYRHEGTARQMFYRDGRWHDVRVLWHPGKRLVWRTR